MDWTMLLNGFGWVMGLLSGGFLAYGGWLCLRGPIGELWQSHRREAPEARPVDQHRLVT